MILAPCYIGYRHDRGPGISPHFDGWYDEIVATGRRLPPLRHYLGRRRRFTNITCMGGDWHRADAPCLDAITYGIRSAGVRNLFTAHRIRNSRRSIPSRAPTGSTSTLPIPTVPCTAR
jgi:hypothetical protein